MDRRVFLREGIMGAGVVACGVGGLWLRSSRARGRIVDELMDGARRVLDRNALEEQEKYPGPAAEEIRCHFDGMILNFSEFLGEISAPEFKKKIKKARTDERRHHELLTALYRRVEAVAHVGDKIHAITARIGPELDRHWSECCSEIAAQWQTRFHKQGAPPFDGAEFSSRVTPLVQQQVDHALQQARRVTEEPAWRETARSLGTEALEASQQASFDIGGRTIHIPEFAVAASRHAFGKVLDLLGDPQVDCQRMVTERLKTLGQQTATEFEKELRRRLNDLHTWRAQAVRQAAEQYAAQRVGFFGEHS